MNLKVYHAYPISSYLNIFKFYVLYFYYFLFYFALLFFILFFLFFNGIPGIYWNNKKKY